jgi:hypothetical protein
MRSIAVTALLAAGAFGLAPAAAAGEPSQQPEATPQDEVSLLAVSLTAGGVATAIGSGAAFVVSRRRDGADSRESTSPR